MLLGFVVAEWVMSCRPVLSLVLARMFVHIYLYKHTRIGTVPFMCPHGRRQKWHGEKACFQHIHTHKQTWKCVGQKSPKPVPSRQLVNCNFLTLHLWEYRNKKRLQDMMKAGRQKSCVWGVMQGNPTTVDFHFKVSMMGGNDEWMRLTLWPLTVIIVSHGEVWAWDKFLLPSLIWKSVKLVQIIIWTFAICRLKLHPILNAVFWTKRPFLFVNGSTNNWPLIEEPSLIKGKN